MKVPARLSVRCTVRESPGWIGAATLFPAPLQPGTPSDQLSSSKPCQWIDVASGSELCTVTSAGRPWVNTSSSPGTWNRLAGGSRPSEETTKLIALGAAPGGGPSLIQTDILRGLIQGIGSCPGLGATVIPMTRPAMCSPRAPESRAGEMG